MRRLLVIVVALVGLVWWAARLLAGARRGRAAGPASRGVMVRDRECNTFLPRARALTSRDGDEERFFCSERCRRSFLERRRAGVAPS